MLVYLKLIVIFMVFNQMSNMTNLKKYPISILSPKGSGAVSIGQPLNNAKSGLFTMEIWKDIKGYKGFYEISNLGNVTSSRINQNLTPGDNGKGYLFVHLWKNRKCKRMYVHRLVLETFNPPNKKDVETNHKNGNKGDNRLINLEWVTKSENGIHAYRTGLNRVSEYQKQQTSLATRGSKQHIAKLKESDILEIRLLKSNQIISNKAIGKMYNVCRQTIDYILSGKTWKHI